MLWKGITDSLIKVEKRTLVNAKQEFVNRLVQYLEVNEIYIKLLNHLRRFNERMPSPQSYDS